MSNSVFIDTSFVIALVNQNDQSHKQATKLADKFETHPLVTTDAVLIEIGNALARNFKKASVEILNHFLSSGEVEIIRLNPTLFAEAFELYRTYMDKTWSLVDCISFIVMREEEIIDALTSDAHFEQAGFHPLMTGKSKP